MKLRFNDYPISHKITAVFMLTAGIGLLFAYMLVEGMALTSRASSALANASAMADVVGLNSTAPLVFSDRSAAQQALSALRANPDVIAAKLMDAQGLTFATYDAQAKAGATDAWTIRQNIPSTFWAESTQVMRPVLLDGEHIGEVWLLFDLKPMRAELLHETLTAAIGTIAAFLVALLVARILSTRIFRPIFELVDATRMVSRDKDYSLRVPRRANDELGGLTDSFNQMLGELEHRDRELLAYRSGLEEKVRVRTEELKRQTENLELAEHRLTLALEGSQLALWDWDLRTNQIYLSEQWGLMRGTEVGVQIVAFSDLENIVHPDDRKRVGETIRDAIRQEGSGHYLAEHRIQTLSGEWKWMQSHGKVMERDADGRATRMTGTNADITAHKAAEEELRYAKEAAESANVAKSQFLAKMSHEIRTPMNGVLGMTELLLQSGLNENQRRLARTVERSAEHLLDIINEILDFSKIEAGKIELEHITFDLVEAIEDVAQMFAERAESKGLEIACSIDVDVPEVVDGDPVRLRQIMVNLVNNAIKFTDRGEIVISVTATRVAPGSVELRAEVRDTGVGITNEARSRIFEPFSQGDGSTTRRFGGTGLGLSIVRQLVKLMGGDVGVESKPGRGSTFWFTVRFATPSFGIKSLPDTVHVGMRSGKSPVAADEGFATPSIEVKHPLRVFIVEHNATSRQILESQCRAAGARVASAADGVAALKMLSTARDAFDVIVFDMQMPDIDGPRLARDIRSLRTATLEPRLVALSSVGYSLDMLILRELHISAWLRKPVRRNDLRRCLEGGPMSAPMEQIAAAGSSETGLPSIQAHVLLVEDNMVNLLVASEMLATLGCQVEVANNGREALSALGHGRFDIVLMDCQMPEMDGYQATREWRSKEPAGERLPIVALTANALDSDRDRCLAAGMDGYLSKPFRREQLAESLMRHLRHDTRAIAVPAPPIEASTPEVIDLRALDNIRILGSGDELLRKVLDAYLKSAPTLMEEFMQALDAANIDRARRAVHTLKSSSANLGATRFSELCKQIEASLRTGDLDRVRAQFHALSQAHDAADDALRMQFGEKTT
ncbi:MAG: response regulator [Betaproteobacteria bacterium]